MVFWKKYFETFLDCPDVQKHIEKNTEYDIDHALRKCYELMFNDI